MDNEKQKKMLKMMYCLKLLKENNLNPMIDQTEYINNSNNVYIKKSANQKYNKSFGNQQIPVNITKNKNGYVLNATNDDYEIDQSSQNKQSIKKNIKKKKKK
jgi:hypothetical protein